MYGILFILLWVLKRGMDDDLISVPTQEFEAFFSCESPLRERNDNHSQGLGARLNKVGIKPTSLICEYLTERQ